MSYLLKQSTAENVMILLVGSSDHISGLAGATLTIAASKDGGAFATITPTVTDRGSGSPAAPGWYNLALTAAMTDTLGAFALHITAASADPTDVLFQVVLDLPGATVTSAGSVTGAVGSVTGAVGSVTGAVGSVTGAVGSVTGDVNGNVVGTVSSVTGNVAGSVASVTGNVNGSVASVAGNVNGNVTGSVGSVAGNVVGTVGDLSTTAAATVKAQVDASVGTDTIPELSQAAPAVTPTMKTALMLLYMTIRNDLKTTATSLAISNNAGTVIAKATLSDDSTTFERTTLVSGP